VPSNHKPSDEKLLEALKVCFLLDDMLVSPCDIERCENLVAFQNCFLGCILKISK